MLNKSPGKSRKEVEVQERDSSTTQDEARAGEEQTFRSLKPNAVGLVGVLFMAVATCAPITAMAGNVPIAVGFGNGIGAPGGYIFALVVLTIFSVGFLMMARYITTAGAFYGFISHGLGRVVGLASGLLCVFCYMIFEPALVGIFSAFAHDTVRAQLGLNVPWPVFAGIMLAAIAILTYFDINLTAKVLAVFLLTEISVLLFMAFGVLFSGGGPDGISLAPLNPINAFKGVAPGLGLIFAFWSWVGFETSAVYGEESKNPKRNVPLAILISVVGVGIFYTFVSWMAIDGNGLHQSVALAKGSNPFALFINPTREFVGGWAVTLFEWLLITGSFACGMAFHNDAARYLYNFGREGFFSRRLGETHPVHGSPHIASFTQTAIATLLVAVFWATGQDPYANLYTILAMGGTLALLLVQTLCSFAVIGYFHVKGYHPEARNWLTTFAAPLVGGIGMIVVVFLLITNFSTAAGSASSSLAFKLIPWIVCAIAIGGMAFSLYLRARKPERYAILGHVVFDPSAEKVTVDTSVREDHKISEKGTRETGREGTQQELA